MRHRTENKSTGAQTAWHAPKVYGSGSPVSERSAPIEASDTSAVTARSGSANSLAPQRQTSRATCARYRQPDRRGLGIDRQRSGCVLAHRRPLTAPKAGRRCTRPLRPEVLTIRARISSSGRHSSKTQRPGSRRLLLATIRLRPSSASRCRGFACSGRPSQVLVLTFTTCLTGKSATARLRSSRPLPRASPQPPHLEPGCVKTPRAACFAGRPNRSSRIFRWPSFGCRTFS